MAPKLSRKRGSDSKQGLVIALVLFVLLSIALGITTYTGYTADEGKDAKIKEKEKARQVLEKDRDWYKFQSLLFLSYMGHLKAEDQQELGILRDKFNQGTLGEPNERPVLSQIMAKIEKKEEMRWDKDKKVETTRFPYDPRYTEAQTKYGEVQDKLDQELQRREAAEALAKAKTDELTAAKEDFLKKSAEQIKTSDTDKKDLITLKESLQDEIKKLGAERELLIKKADDEKTQLQKELADRKRELTDVKTQLKVKIDDLAAIKQKGVEAPKDWRTDWKIVRIDRQGTTAYINLGSADLVKEQLTFSIHGLDLNRKPMAASKGSLEVMNVLGNHLSQVRITSARDSQRDPIMPGDILFNPTWNPTLKKHVAITGLIDMTGEGRDQVVELKRNLERQNIVVDAWVERRGDEAVILGRGITVQTDWLIEGDSLDDVPDLNKNKFAGSLNSAMNKMRSEAKDKGVSVIGYRKYMESIGYRLPRALVDRPSTYRQSLPAGDVPVESKEDKPPMDDKKADDKKDDKKPDDKKDDKKPDDKKDDKKPDDKKDDKN